MTEAVIFFAAMLTLAVTILAALGIVRNAPPQPQRATPARESVSSHLRRWGMGYERRGQGWSAISGYTADDRIFYRETMLACGGRIWHDLAFEYPRSDKLAMDEFVTRASHALGAYSSAGC
jgi:hypothetical protein